MTGEELRTLWGECGASGTDSSGQGPREMGRAASPWTAGESLRLCQVPAGSPT